MSIKAGEVSKKQYESDPNLYTNYVIPVRSYEGNKKGQCKFLREEFLIASNYSEKELQVLTNFNAILATQWDLLDKEKNQIAFYGSNGEPYSYTETIFSRIEDVLNGE